MNTIKTVFLNDDEQPIDQVGRPINIKFPVIPVIGDRINVDELDSTEIESLFNSTRTSVFIVISRHFILDESKTSEILLFVKPHRNLH